MLLHKLACTRPRVLDDYLCPPDDVPHEVEDYPAYYTPLYFPSLFPHVFSDSSAISTWLQNCISAEVHPLNVSVRFEFGFHVTIQYHGMFTLSAVDVSSSLFTFSNIVHCCCGPIWLECSPSFVSRSLHRMSMADLMYSARRCITPSTALVSVNPFPTPHISYPSFHCRRAVYVEFLSVWVTWYTTLFTHVSSSCLSPGRSWNVDSRRELTSAVFSQYFGDEVASKILCVPGGFEDLDLHIVANMRRTLDGYAAGSPDDHLEQVNHLGLPLLRSVYDSIHPSRRDVIATKSVNQISTAIHASFRTRTIQLIISPSITVRRIGECYPGLLREDPDIIRQILTAEYGDDIVSCMLPVREPSPFIQVGIDIVYERLRAYYKNTCIVVPGCCGVCSRKQIGLELTTITINEETAAEWNLSLLRICNETIIKSCIVSQLSNEFMFDDPILDGLMLCRMGVSNVLSTSAVCICSDCSCSLKNGKMPKFALANDLYRGNLPSQFSDLTWVEEMICSVHRTNAVVARLFASSNEKDPLVLHGNTCAHDMNVSSTATVLPRTPADINGMISVVFIGPVMNLKGLKTVFKVRKNRIMSFLLWLKSHNHLYSHVDIDEQVLSLYPDDDVMPGLPERVIFNASSDPASLFQTETAGMQEHPAENVDSVQDDGDIFMDKFGVSDPEQIGLPGRSIRASALATFALKQDPRLADLAVSEGRAALPEYNNPSLVPGMFPTLFPCGIRGFDDCRRRTPISLQSHINLHLDSCDRSF
jgi:hypothetical protein